MFDQILQTETKQRRLSVSASLRVLADCTVDPWFLLFFTVFLTLFFLFSQPARRAPSSQPRVLVCVSSVPLTAAHRLRLPPSACAATATTAGMLTSRMNPAQVSITHTTSHPHVNSYTLTFLEYKHKQHAYPCSLSILYEMHIWNQLTGLLMHIIHYISMTESSRDHLSDVSIPEPMSFLSVSPPAIAVSLSLSLHCYSFFMSAIIPWSPNYLGRCCEASTLPCRYPLEIQ